MNIMSNRTTALAVILGCLISFPSVLSADADPSFLAKIKIRQAAVETEVRDVSYLASAIGRELDEQGKILKTTETVRRVFLKGVHLQKNEYLSLKVDGRELSGKEREKEIAKARQRSGGKRSEMPFTAAVWTNYAYEVGAHAKVDGRPVRLVRFTPVKPAIGSIKGTAYILEETGDIVRMDFEPGRSAFVIQKAEFRLEYAKTAGYWFPETFHMELIIKLKALVDLAYVHVKVKETYSDYRINAGLEDRIFR
jgi:hypothetical protein